MDGIRSHLKEVWWLLMIRGLALLLFGAVAVVWPGLTLLVLSTLFAVYLLVAGVVDIVAGIRGEGRRPLWFLGLLLGLAELGVGVYLLKTGLALSAFIAVLGLSLIAYGVIEMVMAFDPGDTRRFMLIVAAALSIIAGFVVLRYPESSGLAFAWVLGLWGLVTGSIQVSMCLALRAGLEELERPART
jgi:uncharacterized membrane protein HdeD (DUF308 family)